MPLELEDRERRGRDEGHVEGRLEPGHRVIGDERIRGEEQRRDQRGWARAPLEAARQRPHGDDRARMQHQADYFHELQQVVRAEPERQRRVGEVGGSGGLWLTTLYRLTSRRSSLELERNNGARTRLAEEYPACRARKFSRR